MADMSKWQQSFVRNLDSMRSGWLKRFEQAIDECVTPAFDDLAGFVTKHGFRTTTPMRQPDRRSFKFELAENAYLLITFRHEGIDDVQLSCEYFVPGGNPGSYETRMSAGDVTKEWCTVQFQDALDSFVQSFNGPSGFSPSPEPKAAEDAMELLAV